MLSLGLPEAMYCTMDELCLGLECCLDMKVALFRMVYKIYARFDPCASALVVGVEHPVNNFEKSFGPGYGLGDSIGGIVLLEGELAGLFLWRHHWRYSITGKRAGWLVFMRHHL